MKNTRQMRGHPEGAKRGGYVGSSLVAGWRGVKEWLDSGETLTTGVGVSPESSNAPRGARGEKMNGDDQIMCEED